jgi:signal transduction histidine kinase
MGERIRSYDWSSTPLGPPEDWPQSLKTSIRIMLMSRQPVWIGWGSDLLYFYNDPYFSIIGGKHPAALGKPTRQVWSEIWDVIGPMLRTAMSGDEGTYVESQLLIMERNGYPEETYYTFSYSPIPDDEGQPGGIFCANSEDTQRVISQRELALLRELAERTARSATPQQACERSIAALSNGAYDLPFSAIYLVDDEGQVELCGTAGIERGHRLVPEVLSAGHPYLRALQGGEMVTIEDLGSTEDLPRGAWSVPPQRVIALPLAASESLRGGVIVIGPNPYRLLDKGYRGFLGLVAGQVASAISDAEAAERERQRLESMAELDRAKTAFFANVSHEFRTPLTLMLAPLQDALSGDLGSLPERARVELETVHRNGLRLQKLVNALLDFSRLEAGRVRAEFRPTDVGTFTADVASSFRSAIERAGIRLEIDCPPLAGSERPFIDHDLWEKAVLNLVSNAFKHTFEGRIKVSIQREHEDVLLAVSDTGIGIPESELPRLFERFRRVEGAASRSVEGSGIGLALVHEVVLFHGGEISVESRTEGPEHGTTFFVRIPLGTGHLPQDQLSPEATPTAKETTASTDEALSWLGESTEDLESPGSPPVLLRTAGARIVVADDNPDMRGYIKRLLSSNYRVQAVADGQEALEAVRRDPPDLLVTDVMMPRLDGFGLLKAIREDAAISQTPVVMLSARAGEESRIEGLDAGADDYLVKPFTARELLARVDSTLALAALRQETLEELRRSEQQIQTAWREADTERARLRDLFTRAPALVCVLKGPEHVFELANPVYMSAVDRKDADELLGKPIRQALPELEGQPFFDILDRVYDTGEPYFGKEVPVRLARNGSDELEEVLMDFVYQPSRNAMGEVDGILVHAVDVTEQVRARQKVEGFAQELEETVRHRTVELLQANEQLQGFTYSVAHDLRQQIRGISVNAAILLEDAAEALDEESRTTLDRLVRAARKLGILVDDLLAYARLGKAEPDIEPVDLTEMVQSVIQRLVEVESCSANTSFVVEPTPVAFGDPSMLRIVVENLIDNASKYSGKREAPVVEFGYDGGGYFVRDNGAGFDERYAHKLFQPFERLHGDDSFAGTGIGLANVKRIIEKHGGQVSATSRLGEGATFRFTLPNRSEEAGGE